MAETSKIVGLDEVELFAWVGPDDGPQDTGKVGLKQALCPAGYIPIVTVERHKGEKFIPVMMEMAKQTGKPRAFVRFVVAEVIFETE